MRILLANLLLIVIGSTGLAVIAQPKKQNVLPPEKIIVLPEDDPAAEFSEKGLPVPPVLGENPSDKLAAKLAKDISKYDEKGLAVLIAALQKAGFYIIDRNQKTLFQPTVTDDMGMAFYDFEVVGMYNASRMGMATTVKNFAGLIAPEATQIETFPILILRDLKAAKTSPNRRVRFIAALIFELGKAFATPVDLNTAAPENATLNIIQASILERVLLADLMAAYEKLSEGNGLFHEPDLFKRNKFGFQRVGFVPKKDLVCDSLADVSSVKKAERTVYRIIERVLTFKKMIEMGNENLANVRFDRMPVNLQYQEQIKFLQKFGLHIRIGNLVMSYVKLVLALMSVKIELTVQEPMPLIRTQSTYSAGESKIVTGKFTLDFLDKNKSEYLLCASSAFEIATGIKFGVPKNAPMGQKPVSWEIMTPAGVQNIIDTPVFLDSLNKTDTSKQKTDDDGVSRVKLTGKPLPEEYATEILVPIRKTVDLKASIALEKMDLQSDAAKIGKLMLDRTDDGLNLQGNYVPGIDGNLVPGTGVGSITSSLVLSIIESIPDILSKMKLRSQTIRVPVRDWTPCSEDWGGFINFKRDLKKPPEIIKASRQSNGNSSGDGIRDVNEYDEAEITFNPRKPEELKTKPKIPANIYVSGHRLTVFTGVRENDPCCGKTEGKFSTKFREGKEETYAAALKRMLPTDALVSYSSSERDFSLGLSFNTDLFKTKLRDFYEVTQTSCELEEDPAKSEESESMRQMNYRLDIGRYGKRTVIDGVEILEGEKFVPAPDGANITWSWSLVRCKGNKD